MLSFTLSDQTISKLRELSQSASRRQLLLGQLAPAERDYIHRNVRISMIGASTRIENAVLTDAEVDWLDTVLTKDSHLTAYDDQRQIIQDKLSKDKERSIDEVAGSRAILHLIYSQPDDFRPLTETVVRGLHNELMQYYAPAQHYRGRYKVASNRVVRRDNATGEETTVLEPSAPGPITESAMQELMKWYNDTVPTHPWTVAAATEFVFRFLAIHPFQDGNGRMARALFLLALLQSPDEGLCAVAPYLPIDRHIEKQREDYYIVLRRGSLGKFSLDPAVYEYDHFLRFMMKAITDALDDIGFYQKRYAALQNLPPAALKVLGCFRERPETRLQRKDIIQDAKLPRATATLALSNLVNQGFIQRSGRGAGVRYQLVF
jgi:Fic family protein